ncbi:hypothetical protein AX14_005872 [Amanita brunnescens Koide BX004]|nr:hypothetical protein AX14_005872 [Amanita brunnescens Koide BX004]
MPHASGPGRVHNQGTFRTDAQPSQASTSTTPRPQLEASFARPNAYPGGRSTDRRPEFNPHDARSDDPWKPLHWGVGSKKKSENDRARSAARNAIRGVRDSSRAKQHSRTSSTRDNQVQPSVRNEDGRSSLKKINESSHDGISPSSGQKTSAKDVSLDARNVSARLGDVSSPTPSLTSGTATQNRDSAKSLKHLKFSKKVKKDTTEDVSPESAAPNPNPKIDLNGEKINTSDGAQQLISIPETTNVILADALIPSHTAAHPPNGAFPESLVPPHLDHPKPNKVATSGTTEGASKSPTPNPNPNPNPKKDLNGNTPDGTQQLISTPETQNAVFADALPAHPPSGRFFETVMGPDPLARDANLPTPTPTATHTIANPNPNPNPNPNSNSVEPEPRRREESKEAAAEQEEEEEG